MTLGAPVADCQRRIAHTDDQFERMRSIARSAQPDVQPYLEEALCCFAVGAYRGSVVSAWRGAGARLRGILSGFGHEICTPYLKKDDEGKSLSLIDGESLLEPIRKLQALPSADVAGLAGFWRVRCTCAHPSDATVGPDDVVELLRQVENFLARPAATETIRNVGALYNTFVAHRRLDDIEAARWCTEAFRHVYPDSLTSLCEIVYARLLSAPGEGLPDKRRLLVMWRALLWPLELDRDAVMNPEARDRLLSRVVEDLGSAGIDKALQGLRRSRWDDSVVGRARLERR